MKKLYCKQVNPAIQTAPELEGFENDVILTGNPRMVGFNADYAPWNLIQTRLDSAGIEYMDQMPPATSTEAVNKYLQEWGFYPPECANRKDWTAEEVNQWIKLLDTTLSADEPQIYLPALALLTGEEWAETTLHGDIQSDWQRCIYRKDVTADRMPWLEAVYFNTGMEWLVSGLSEEFPGLDSFEGVSVYCPDTYVEDVRKYLAELYGVTPEQVVLYEYVGRMQWIDAWEVN